MARPTLRLFADPADPGRSRQAIEQAAAILRAGGTVAFPTETVYGLGANALDPDAISRIFSAKMRPAWDPLIVHIADLSMLGAVAADVPPAAQLWMDRFWPGPLTLLLPRAAAISDAVTAGRPLVGVRMPQHPVAQALLQLAGVPVAAPSANLFGHVSPTAAAHVLADLDGRIDAMLDGGLCEHGVESSVVDATSDPCVLYRPGAITLEQLKAIWPQVSLYHAENRADNRLQEEQPQSLPSPGVGLRHYAPAASLLLIEYGPRQVAELREVLLAGSGTKTGVLLPLGLLPLGTSLPRTAASPPETIIFPWGEWGKPETLARLLFAGLRSLDALGVSRIVCPVPPAEGLGAAICDRLRKAARKT